MSTNSVMPSGNSGAPTSNIGFSKNENLTNSFADNGSSFPSTQQQGDSIQIGQQNSKDNSGQAPLQGAESTVLNDLSNLARTLSKADAGDNGDSDTSGHSGVFNNLLGTVGKQELQQGLKNGNLDEAKNGLNALQQSSKDAASADDGAGNQDATSGQVKALALEVTDLLKTLVNDMTNSQSKLSPDSSASSDTGDSGQSVKQLLSELAKSLGTSSGDTGNSGGVSLPSAQGGTTAATGAAPAAASTASAAPTAASPASTSPATGAATAGAGGTAAPLGTGPDYQTGINAGEQSINHLLGTMSSGGTGTGAGAGADASGPAGTATTASSASPAASGTGGTVTPSGASSPSASGASGWSSQTESELGSQLESQGYSLVKNAQSEPGVGAAALQGAGAQAPLATATPSDDTSAGLG